MNKPSKTSSIFIFFSHNHISCFIIDTHRATIK